MPVRKIDEDDLMFKLTEVFRVHGFEGASLSRLSEATGLKRASLYHRFPGGKEEMAEAVLKKADEWFMSHILAPLSEAGGPSARIQKMADRISDFYGRGQHSCLLDSLSLGKEDLAIRRHIEGSFAAWLGALIKVAREAGLSPALARERSEEALIRIQGALVMSRATGETKPFLRVLKSLPQLLTTELNETKPKTKRSKS
jgi:AcrR family transcriptional regulator